LWVPVTRAELPVGKIFWETSSLGMLRYGEPLLGIWGLGLGTWGLGFVTKAELPVGRIYWETPSLGMSKYSGVGFGV
jgi:hypothetical protein